MSTRRHRLIILIVVAVALLVLVGGYLLYLFMPQSDPNAEPAKPSDPFVHLLSGETGPTVTQAVRQVPLTDGTDAAIPDPTRLPQEAGHVPEQGYVLAGGTDQSFRILFYAAPTGGTDRFLITLFEEPLGQARLESEAALRAYTGLPSGQLCRIVDLQVWAAEGMGGEYAGRELGLSFCPDAVRLP